MKVVFYHELPASEGVSLRDVLLGKVPSSGGLGRIYVSTQIAHFGVQVVVLHHLASSEKIEQVEGVTAVRVGTADEVITFIKTLERSDVAVLNFFDGVAGLIAACASARCHKLLWAGCNPPSDWCDWLDGQQLDRIVCVSQAAARQYRFQRNFNRVDHIYSSLSTGQALPDPENPVPGRVAFLGALREEKGFQHVLTAWPLVRKAFPEATLDVHGSIRLHFPRSEVGQTGVLTPQFERRYLDPIVTEAGGDWNRLGIRFTFPQAKPALLQQLAKTWVGVVNPNLRGSIETYCLSAVEMQACGCPCIGAGVGGLLETIADKQSGYHLKTQKPSELAGRILEVLRDPGLRARLSAGAVAHSAALASTAREAKDWIRLMGDVVEGRLVVHPPSMLRDVIAASGILRMIRMAVRRVKSVQI